MDFWLERALHEIDTVTDGLSPATLSISPAAGKWSAAQVMGHLSITFRQTVGALARVLQSGKPSAGKRSFVQWLSIRVVADLGYFPTGRQAPPTTLPSDLPPEQVMREIRENLVAMDAVINEVEQKLGSGIAIANHPVLGPLTVQEWRKFHYRHTHHHLRQVMALKRKFGGAQGATAS